MMLKTVLKYHAKGTELALSLKSKPKTIHH